METLIVHLTEKGLSRSVAGKLVRQASVLGPVEGALHLQKSGAEYRIAFAALSADAALAGNGDRAPVSLRRVLALFLLVGGGVGLFASGMSMLGYGYPTPPHLGSVMAIVIGALILKFR